jgi:hypothetical protein
VTLSEKEDDFFEYQPQTSCPTENQDPEPILNPTLQAKRRSKTRVPLQKTLELMSTPGSIHPESVPRKRSKSSLPAPVQSRGCAPGKENSAGPAPKKWKIDTHTSPAVQTATKPGVGEIPDSSGLKEPCIFPECSAKLKNMMGVQFHLSLTHFKEEMKQEREEGISPGRFAYSCDYCKRKFTYQTTLKSHMMTKHADLPYVEHHFY